MAWGLEHNPSKNGNRFNLSLSLGFSPTLLRAALPVRFPQVDLVSSLIPTVFDASLVAQLPERCVGVKEAVKKGQVQFITKFP